MDNNQGMDNFYKETTFHGVYYLNTVNKRSKIFWSTLIVFVSLSIICGTALFLVNYLSYDTNIVVNEEYFAEIDKLPYFVACESHSLYLTDSLTKLQPDLINFFHSIYNSDSLMKYIDNEEGKLDELNRVVDTKNLTSYKRLFDRELIRLMLKINEMELFDCQLHYIDCYNYTNHIFTLHGVCLVIDLNKALNNRSLAIKFNEFSYIKQFKYLTQILIISQNPNKRLFFGFTDDLNQVVYSVNSNLEEKDASDFYTVFSVAIESLTYSKSLHNIKCEPDNQEIQCQFECIQTVIKKSLNCHFSLDYNDDGITGQYACTILYLPVIEYIIQNYKMIKEKLNVPCRPCLPNCESTSYSTNNENIYEPSTWQPDDSHDIYIILSDKIIRRQFILSFEYSSLLNFINGLWSLFFGISILSFWELVELSFIFMPKSLSRKEPKI